MRIAIVNDVPMIAEGLKRVLEPTDYVIAWIAYDGEQAVNFARTDTPDVILMDLKMPVMDGVDATKLIMEQSPCAILLVTASVDEYIADVFKAMSYGAMDAVVTPLVSSGDTTAGAEQLLKKITTVIRAANTTLYQLAGQKIELSDRQGTPSATGLIAVGASSGGPSATIRVFEKISQSIPAAMVLIQHVDQPFVPRLVDWMNNRLDLEVRQARQGDILRAGTVYMAATESHLILNSDGSLDYTVEPESYPYTPSIDVFFNSVVEHWHLPACGVLLTGMGADGAMGLKRMKQKGFYTIAQDEQSCAVYGMPKAAREMRAAVDELPLNKIGEAVERFCHSRMGEKG